jgi:hypothetical protein
MKLKILSCLSAFLSCLLMCSSCETIQQKKAFKQYTIIHAEAGGEIQLYIIDSCEYIGHVNGLYTDFLTHKGNCKFCLERKNK